MQKKRTFLLSPKWLIVYFISVSFFISSDLSISESTLWFATLSGKYP
nr:MAG TPA: hypothetical protein [Caudoviricetes sp.]